MRGFILFCVDLVSRGIEMAKAGNMQVRQNSRWKLGADGLELAAV